MTATTDLPSDLKADFKSGRRFYSAIDVSLLFLVLLPLLSIPLINSPPWQAYLLLLLLLGATIGLLWPCYYQLNQDHLLVRCGVLIQLRIPYQQIRQVAKSRSVVAGPALSMNRLAIDYGRMDQVLISPKDQAGFWAALQQRISASTNQSAG